MNPIKPTECLERGWTKVRMAPTEKHLEVLDWLESTVGDDNWTVWFGDFYFASPGHATAFMLKWSS